MSEQEPKKHIPDKNFKDEQLKHIFTEKALPPGESDPGVTKRFLPDQRLKNIFNRLETNMSTKDLVPGYHREGRLWYPNTSEEEKKQIKVGIEVTRNEEGKPDGIIIDLNGNHFIIDKTELRIGANNTLIALNKYVTEMNEELMQEVFRSLEAGYQAHIPGLHDIAPERKTEDQINQGMQELQQPPKRSFDDELNERIPPLQQTEVPPEEQGRIEGFKVGFEDAPEVQFDFDDMNSEGLSQTAAHLRQTMRIEYMILHNLTDVARDIKGAGITNTTVEQFNSIFDNVLVSMEKRYGQDINQSELRAELLGILKGEISWLQKKKAN